jgi:hypothetical protein
MSENSGERGVEWREEMAHRAAALEASGYELIAEKPNCGLPPEWVPALIDWLRLQGRSGVAVLVKVVGDEVGVRIQLAPPEARTGVPREGLQ